MRRSLSAQPTLPDFAGARIPERSTLETIRSLLPYLWPKDSAGARVRVSLAMLFLIAAKGATVLVPLVYSRAVDALSITPPGGATDSIRWAMPTWSPIAV